MIRRGVALLLGLWAWTAAADPLVPARLAPLFDTSHDQLLQRSAVPSEADRVGEVRLVRRGDYDVVQTLLWTKILSRVVAEIRTKELANWPAGKPGHDDALSYVEALDTVRKAIWNQLPKDERAADRRQKMWIEFVLGDRSAAVGVGSFELDDAADPVRVRSRATLALLEPSRDYVRRNMQLIVADSFHVEEAALAPLLAPLRRLGDRAAQQEER